MALEKCVIIIIIIIILISVTDVDFSTLEKLTHYELQASVYIRGQCRGLANLAYWYVHNTIYHIHLSK